MKAAANGVLNLSTLDGWWAEAWRADDETGLVHRDNAQPAQDFRMVGDLLLAHCDPLAEKVQIAVHTRRAISSLRVRALVDACASCFWPKWGSDCSQTP